MHRAHSNQDLEAEHLPASSELHVSIKKSSDLASGSFPAFNTSSDKAFPLLVAHHLHEAWVSFIDVFF